MIRPVQFFDEEKLALTKDMPIADILEFLEGVREMTPLATYWEIHHEYVEGFEKNWKKDYSSSVSGGT